MEILIKLMRQIFGWGDKAENIVLGINLKGTWESSSNLHNPIPHPDNAPGSFYTLKDCCITCGAPEMVAPELMGWSVRLDGTECIFRRQPQTPEEVEMAINAMDISCIANLRYRGSDPVIIEKLKAMGNGYLCDMNERESFNEI